jgi:hypothetical protein
VPRPSASSRPPEIAPSGTCRGSSGRPPSSSRRAIVMVQPAEHGKPEAELSDRARARSPGTESAGGSRSVPRFDHGIFMRPFASPCRRPIQLATSRMRNCSGITDITLPADDNPPPSRPDGPNRVRSSSGYTTTCSSSARRTFNASSPRSRAFLQPGAGSRPSAAHSPTAPSSRPHRGASPCDDHPRRDRSRAMLHASSSIEAQVLGRS